MRPDRTGGPTHCPLQALDQHPGGLVGDVLAGRSIAEPPLSINGGVHAK
jgi:hypothetical protein